MRFELGKLELFGLDLRGLWQRWWRGLNSLTPVPLAELFLRPTPRLRVRMEQEQVIFDHILPGQVANVLVQLGCSELAMLEDNSLREKLGQDMVKRLLQLDLVLPQEQVLRRNVSVPAAARGNLRQALGFQISKLTPFSRDQVYFDVLERPDKSGTGMLETELQVVSKAFAEQWMMQASRVTGLPVARLQVIGESGGPDTTNLLGELGVPSYWFRRLNKNSFLAGFLVFMIAVAVVAPVVKLRLDVILGKREITALDRKVGGTRHGWYGLQKSVGDLEFMLTEHAKHGRPTLILGELTQLIPDDIFLTSLSIEKDRIEIAGQGKNVVNLVQTLNDSKYFEQASFSSAITRGRDGLDIFAISMRLAMSEAEQ